MPGKTKTPELQFHGSPVICRDTSPFGPHLRCLMLCRFSDAGMPRPSPRSDSRRPKSAKARNRGVWGTDSAAVLWGFGVGVSVGEVEPTLAIALL